MGWLEGAVRLMPGWDIQIGGLLIPAIFWPAVVLPGLIFTPLFLVPWLDWVAHARRRLPQRAHAARPAPRAHGAGRRVRHLPHACCWWPAATTCSPFVYGWSQPTLLRDPAGPVIVLPPVVALLTYAIVRGRARRWASTVR